MGLGGTSWNRWHESGQHDGREKEPDGPLHGLIIAPAEGAFVRRMGTWLNASSNCP